MYYCVEVNFGGEIGTRPAMVLKKDNEKTQVMKITTKCKASATDFKTKLSGFSGVKGYIVNNRVYVVPNKKILKKTNTLFDYEAKNAINSFNQLRAQGKAEYINIR